MNHSKSCRLKLAVLGVLLFALSSCDLFLINALTYRNKPGAFAPTYSRLILLTPVDAQLSLNNEPISYSSLLPQAGNLLKEFKVSSEFLSTKSGRILEVDKQTLAGALKISGNGQYKFYLWETPDIWFDGQYPLELVGLTELSVEIYRGTVILSAVPSNSVWNYEARQFESPSP